MHIFIYADCTFYSYDLSRFSSKAVPPHLWITKHWLHFAPSSNWKSPAQLCSWDGWNWVTKHVWPGKLRKMRKKMCKLMYSRGNNPRNVGLMLEKSLIDGRFSIVTLLDYQMADILYYIYILYIYKYILYIYISIIYYILNTIHYILYIIIWLMDEFMGSATSCLES